MTSTVPGDGRKFPRDLGMARLRIWGGPSTQAHDAWRWVVDWTSPWGGPAEGMSTIPSIAPWNDLTSARRALGAEGARGSRYWVLAPSSTAEHALLIGQSRVDDGNPQIFLLDANSPPVEVLRFDGQPVGAFEDAMRARGRWIFATAQGSNQLSATVVWAIQDGTMRELARVPRSIQGARVPARLATRSDSDTIGLVVEGQVDAVRRQAMLWVMPIGSGSGVVDEPEELSPARLGENAIPLCSASDTGWVVEMRYAGHVRLELDGRWTRLYSPVSRLRISRQGACLEGLLGTPESPTGRLSSGKGAGSKTIAQDPVDRAARRTIDVGALSSVAVRSLRCWQSSP